MLYRKKPVVVEAIQWNGLNLKEIEDFAGQALDYEIYDTAYQASVAPPKARVIIHTLEGDHVATVGDYIIKGVKGEFYPCKPEIFAETYEAVE